MTQDKGKREVAGKGNYDIVLKPGDFKRNRAICFCRHKHYARAAGG